MNMGHDSKPARRDLGVVLCGLGLGVLSAMSLLAVLPGLTIG
jgi:hypothetical protein